MSSNGYSGRSDDTNHANGTSDHHPELLEEEDRQLLILYASQTGSAQDVAEYIGREAWRRYFRARVIDIKDFDRNELMDAPPTIIVTSTTGQGAFPSSLLPLWDFLIRSDLPPELLHDFTYTIFGLGDSSYPKFNWPARKLKRRLEQLGAHELVEKGEADDQHYLGVDGTLMPWLDNLWSTLLQHFPLPPGVGVIPPHTRPPPRLRLRKRTSSGHTSKPPLLPIHGMKTATLILNKRVTAQDHFQDTRHIILELEEECNYAAGDILEVRPENLPEEVDAFLTAMKWQDQADITFDISASSESAPLPQHWPSTTTLRQLCISYLDIFSVPRRSFFEWLSYFTTSELETDKLREFCTAEGQEDMYDYSNRPRRTIAEILLEFKSAQIPLDYIADIFPEIRPRQFSIASSRKTNPRRVELLVAIVRYKTILKLPRKGVATSWLATLQLGHKLAVDFVKGTLRLPEDPSTPVICIGPGTGIAPFRSLINERLAIHPESKNNVVFFGCRSAQKDFYFAEGWAALQEKGDAKLVLAASRDQEDKIYVQHKIKDEAELLWKYIGEQAGVVYVSGSSGQMPKSVQKALKSVFQTQGRISEEEANAYFDTMETEGRYQEETWS